MDNDNSNTSGVRAKIKYSRVKRRILKHVWPIRVLLVALVLAILGALTFASVRFSENLGVGNYFVLAYNFLTASTGKIASSEGRTNILVMGRSGGSHDGPDLTDTMMLVSVGLTSPSVTIISIPRDLWIPEIRAKINAAYYWGDKNTPYFSNVGLLGGGIAFAKSIAEEVVGKPIHYGVVIDFSGFKDVIDALGGIQVEVANSFTDKLYPIAGRENDLCGGDPTYACRYETITFNAGLQTMDGETALKFVRSRHAEGIEGTDLAREERQQKVVDAVKDKITNPRVFLSLKVDLAMWQVARKYVQTDIDGPTAAILARKIIDGRKSINQYLIPDELLSNPPISAAYDLQFVFIPKAGNGKWGEIQKWFDGVLK